MGPPSRQLDARRNPAIRPTRRKPETRVVVIGDSDFAANSGLGFRATAKSLHEHRRLAVAAGEPDLDPSKNGRSAHTLTATTRQTSSGSRC